jgi:cytochrome c
MLQRCSRAGKKLGVMAIAIACAGSALAGACGSAAAQAQERQGTLPSDEDGKSLFARCSPCHALALGRNGRGPTLYHLFGRKSGSVAGYDYSLAMKRGAIIWRDDTLARFLIDPRRVVPETTMVFAGIADVEQAKALIDYLRTATR